MASMSATTSKISAVTTSRWAVIHRSEETYMACETGTTMNAAVCAPACLSSPNMANAAPQRRP
jgi:hypothetical protein